VRINRKEDVSTTISGCRGGLGKENIVKRGGKRKNLLQTKKKKKSQTGGRGEGAVANRFQQKKREKQNDRGAGQKIWEKIYCWVEGKYNRK